MDLQLNENEISKLQEFLKKLSNESKDDVNIIINFHSGNLTLGIKAGVVMETNDHIYQCMQTDLTDYENM